MAGWISLWALTSGYMVRAEQNTVTAHVAITKKSEAKQEKAASGPSDASNVVIWLKPVDHSGGEVASADPGRKRMQLVQRNKSFQPHLLVVPVGSVVDFPNRDPFFHNVFSLFEGKRFDLGLYEAGSTRDVRFDKPGISYIFCNIHPQMSAVVVVLKTRYFAVTDPDGNFQISHVPPGHYKIVMWYELATEGELKSVEKEVDVLRGDNEISQVVLHSSDAPPEHMNKEGEPYYSSSPKTR